jgi:hypothetical protein
MWLSGSGPLEMGGRLLSAGTARSRASICNAGEGVDVLLVAVRQRVKILLSRLDLRVSHPFHNTLQVGAAGEQPRRMCVAKVVHTDVEIQTRGPDRRKPNARPEGVARDCRPGFSRKEELVSAEIPM